MGLYDKPTLHVPVDQRDQLPPDCAYLVLPVVMSPTRVELGARCYRRLLLEDVLRLSAYKSPSALFGDRMHAGTDAWWQNAGLAGPERYLAARNAILTDWNVPDGGRKPHTQELAGEMLDAYVKGARLAGDMPGEWRLVSGEQRLTQALSDDVVMAYKVDRLVGDKEGRLAILDTKTSARPDARWEAGMKRSVQQRCYKALEQERLGREIEFGLIEGLPKNGNLAPKYVWASLGWTDEYVEEALTLARAVGEKVVEFVLHVHAGLPRGASWEDLRRRALEHAGGIPDFNYQDCQSYGMPCPYMETCDAHPDDRLGLLQDPEEFQVPEGLWHAPAALTPPTPPATI